MSELFSVDLTVSDLTALIKKTLEESFYGLRVTGEISNFRPSSTGHWFFTLKDNQCTISAVMFKSSTWKIDFSPQEGDLVVVTGSLDVYGARGTYQLKCDTMEKAGQGALLEMLEMRKRKWAALGYFDEKTKKKLPVKPQRVGVVTSPTGAALQDILQILKRRAPSLDVLVLPAVVQGTNAAQSIANRIDQANNLLLCDVLIVGRGGGSLEDLLPFSEDVVIEAIHRSQLPVVSAVGHEIDWALSDFVADLRAPTPSAAAELISQGFLDSLERIQGVHKAMQQTMTYRLHIAEQRLRSANVPSLARSISHILQNREYNLANAGQNLSLGMKDRLQSSSMRLQLVMGELQALSPLAILARGYSVIKDKDGKLVGKAEQLVVGQRISLVFNDGERKARVEE